MKKHVTITILTILLATLACSVAWSEDTREVRLGNYLLLRVRCAAGGYTVDERVAALQQRANNLLKAGKEYSTFTVRKSGNDANIYVDDTFFMTVGPADAEANGTTSEKLANTWAERLRNIFPRSTPDKPGVGRPGQEGAPGNAQ
ncbi:MAG: hypothetical protein M1133_09130 [Armatimonadetes bacterium]|nr:hypothetical protein [Armatimonadota bacterium]